MKYRIKGKGDVNLSKKDFIASGGEGAIYVKGSTAFKIYMKPERMIPEPKIKELSVIKNSNVIKPENVLLNNRNRPVGYSMRFVKDTHALCQLFTKAFKKRNNLSPDTVLELVVGLREGVSDIHASGILVVDLNEMNFLVEKRFKEVYFIDADSYQTAHYPATALMDSIKDWHANGKWTKGSDWFSWGIVSFQLFTGIHPYKGKHKHIKNMAERMQKNISVFSSDVKVPRMVPSFDAIPEVYRRWYKAVFEQGKRVAPPMDMVAVAYVAPMHKVSSTDQLNIVQLINIGADIMRFELIGEHEVVIQSGCVHWMSQKGVVSRTQGDSDFHLGLLPDGSLVEGYIKGGLVQLWEVRKRANINVNIRAQKMMSYDGRLYVHNGENILEIQFMQASGYIASSVVVANVMPMATRLFDGVAIQDMLGSWYASIFPKSRSSYQIRLKELDGYKIIDAKFDTRVLMVVGSKAGKYDKFIFRLERDFQNYVFWKDEDIVYSGINFVVLGNGLCAHINEDEELMLFSSSPAQDTVKKISDPVISGDMRLFKRGNDVLFARGSELFKLSTRK